MVAEGNKIQNEFSEVMISILGKDAYHSSDFKISSNVELLSRTVNYLFTQLTFCKEYMPDEDKYFVDEIKMAAICILKGDNQISKPNK